MEPLIETAGLALTLAEILLGVLMFGAGVLLALFLTRRGQAEAVRKLGEETAAKAAQENQRLQTHLSDMQAAQAALQGRLAQFADDSAKRDNMFRERLDARLDQVSERVGKSISHTQEKTTENLSRLHERLGLIDAAQNNIKSLAGEVQGLQAVLSNKQARGAFGEKQMQDLIRTYLPPRSFSFQATLSNASRVDALIHMPEGHGDVAIDSKFPMESWRRMVEAETSFDAMDARKSFQRDVLKHIKDISGKYLLPGETHELALLFLPSDAIFTELHSEFDEVIDKSFNARVVIVSPTTFMATLHTMQAVMNDAEIQKNAALIKREVAVLAEDIGRLDDRVAKLQSHFNMAVKDVTQIQTSTRKITNRAEKIARVDFESVDDSAATPPLKLVSDSDS